jgi:hypothetical protein
MITSSGVPTRAWARKPIPRDQDLYEELLAAMLAPVDDDSEEPVTD